MARILASSLQSEQVVYNVGNVPWFPPVWHVPLCSLGILLLDFFKEFQPSDVDSSCMEAVAPLGWDRQLLPMVACYSLEPSWLVLRCKLYVYEPKITLTCNHLPS